MVGQHQLRTPSRISIPKILNSPHLSERNSLGVGDGCGLPELRRRVFEHEMDMQGVQHSWPARTIISLYQKLYTIELMYTTRSFLGSPVT
jgi:hypothetical protein